LRHLRTGNFSPETPEIESEERKYEDSSAPCCVAALRALRCYCSCSDQRKWRHGPAQVDRIIRSFTTKEAQFRRALNTYSFKRDALIQSIGMGGQVIGEYHRVSTFTFDDQGDRFEKISFFPMSTLPEITQEDVDDLGGVNPFALEPGKADLYNFRYAGKEKIDELDLFIFDVSPKVMPDPKKIKDRLFSGRIWVDTQDLQIVKTKGRVFPRQKIISFRTSKLIANTSMETYWFPTYSSRPMKNSSLTMVAPFMCGMKVALYGLTETKATRHERLHEIGEKMNHPVSDSGVAKPTLRLVH
jgi:hypothetical protein